MPPKKRHFIDFIVKDDEIDASVRTYRVPEGRAQALLELMGEYLIERTPTGRPPAYEQDPPPEILNNPIPEGTTIRHGGEALMWARLHAGLTQLELARELRVSQADLSKMETGKRSIGKRLARKFAHYFTMDYRSFL